MAAEFSLVPPAAANEEVIAKALVRQVVKARFSISIGDAGTSSDQIARGTGMIGEPILANA